MLDSMHTTHSTAGRSRKAGRLLVAFALVGASMASLGGCPEGTSELARAFRTASASEFESGVNSLADGDSETALASIADGIISGLFSLYEPDASPSN